tara:strand:+ start:930 stop:1391 length:462 start_codon:yes stop_codon:yes gene_type:complete
MKFIKPSPKSVLSLDIGKRRIGLAYCDALFITVSLLPAVKRSIDLKEIQIFKKHILNLNITGMIIGLPLDENGQITNQAKDCMEYGEIITRNLNLPFNYVNEHSSTWESINTYGIRKDKSGLIDSYSAKVILEQWIREGPELKEIVFNNEIKY